MQCVFPCNIRFYSHHKRRPWQKVYCISGSVKDAISAEMVKAHKETPEAYHADYDYYPPNAIPPTYAQRRQDFGRIFYTWCGS